MSATKGNPAYAQDVLEFVALSAQLCAQLEKSAELEREDFVGSLLRLLPLVYAKAQQLPEVETDGAFAPDGQVTEDDYNYIRSGAYALLRSHDEYELLVWDEDMQTEESRWCSLSEGLADLYQVLRNFVAVYQQRLETCMPDALWQLRDSFELYWGQTLLDTLRQLHRVRYTFTRSDENEEDSQQVR